jgi:hypothetical protein
MACRQGRLGCTSPLIPFVSRITEEQARQIPKSLETALSVLSLWAPPPLTEGPDTGDPSKVSGFWRFLNRPILPPLETIFVAYELSKEPEQQRSQLGKQISEIASISPPGACLGYFDSAVTDGFEGGAQVNGWAWSAKEKVVPTHILLVNAAGKVVGLASRGINRPDVIAAKLGVTDPGTGWRGYAKEGSMVAAYALIDNGRQACRLTGTFDIVSATYENHRVGISRALSVRAFVNRVYAFLMPVLLGAGLAAILISILTRGAIQAPTYPTLLLAGFIWLLLFSQIAIILVTDVFLFHSMNYSYLAAAYPLSCVAPMLSIWTAIQCFSSNSVES